MNRIPGFVLLVSLAMLGGVLTLERCSTTQQVEGCETWRDMSWNPADYLDGPPIAAGICLDR